MSRLAHPVVVLLSALVMALSMLGAPGAERGLGALVERLFCGCAPCGEREAVPADCCEDEPAGDLEFRTESSCCCSASPSVPERGAPPSGPPRVADAGGLFRQCLEDGAAVSARTPSLCGPACASSGPPTVGLGGAPRSAAGPPGTALSGGQRLRLAGASSFVHVLGSVRC